VSFKNITDLPFSGSVAGYLGCDKCGR